MESLVISLKKNIWLTAGILFLLAFSSLILRSIAPSIFPLYFLFIFLGVATFLFFAQIEFAILAVFSNHLYIFSLVFLTLPLLIGSVTRGAVRWIPIGALTLQPAELVRPFLIIFFAQNLATKQLDTKGLAKALALLAPPVLLILIQPSLGVAFLTVIGFVGVLLASTINKKTILLAFVIGVVLMPLSWFVLADYQRSRIFSFITPSSDPSGAGYNSIQSMIAVGSGKLTGRGLGEGVQTQLNFLPERHTDFIFASISEELGMAGSFLILVGVFFLLYRVVMSLENAKSPQARAFISGIFLTLFIQSLIHIGMNMGLFPITGVPLPLVSAGGSSLLGTMTALGMVIGAKK